jgi:hypothetical protein
MNGSRTRVLISRLTLRVAMAVISAAVLILVLASPIALKWLAGVHGIDWSNLSNVGQTYGAISALLAALALGGVAVSLLYQARDYRASREQTNRSIHNQLLQMEMRDPFYMDIMAVPWGKTVGLDDYDSMRRSNFILMWLQYWEGLYILGDMTEEEVRDTIRREVFTSPYGRQHWSVAGKIRLQFATGRHLKFAKIIDDEYQKMIESGFPVAATPDNKEIKQETKSHQITRRESGLLIFLASGGVVLAGHLLRRQLCHRH